MARQLSSSLSDLMLAISAFYVAHHWYEHAQEKAALGIAIQGLAASFGVIRFALQEPQESIIYTIHKLLSWVAGAVGVPLIALSFCAKHGSASLGNKILMFVACVVVVAVFLPPKTREVCSQAVSGFCLISTTILCYANNNFHGLMACITYIVAGMAFGSGGTLMEIPKVDFLHYLLIVGNTLFKMAL